jgi:hypothetical protein
MKPSIIVEQSDFRVIVRGPKSTPAELSNAMRWHAHGVAAGLASAHKIKSAQLVVRIGGWNYSVNVAATWAAKACS